MFAVNVAGDSQLAKDLYDVLMQQSEFTLQITPPRSVPTFAKDDVVTMYGDNGDPLRAVILEVSDDSVRVSYQGGKYTTSLPKASVTTEHRAEFPAKVEVVR